MTSSVSNTTEPLALTPIDRADSNQTLPYAKPTAKDRRLSWLALPCPASSVDDVRSVEMAAIRQILNIADCRVASQRLVVPIPSPREDLRLPNISNLV